MKPIALLVLSFLLISIHSQSACENINPLSNRTAAGSPALSATFDGASTVTVPETRTHTWTVTQEVSTGLSVSFVIQGWSTGLNQVLRIKVTADNFTSALSASSSNVGIVESNVNNSIFVYKLSLLLWVQRRSLPSCFRHDIDCK